MNATRLVELLERVAKDEIVTPQTGGTDGSAAAKESETHGAWPGQEAGLTEREAELVSLITQGYSNPEIAASMYITVNTVKTYIRSAYWKMGVERRAQAVSWGIAHNMLP